MTIARRTFPPCASVRGRPHPAVAVPNSAVQAITNARRAITLPTTRFVRVGLSPAAKRHDMDAPDLSRRAPPRWNVAVDGVIWLPRLAAKVRAHDAGTLGTYLLGQSPIDDEFLRVAQLRYAGLIAIVRASAGDGAVLAGIGAASPGAVERLRLWSLEMPVRRRAFMRVLDFDDGYERPGWLDGPHRAVSASLVPLFIGLVRKVRPLKA